MDKKHHGLRLLGGVLDPDIGTQTILGLDIATLGGESEKYSIKLRSLSWERRASGRAVDGTAPSTSQLQFLYDHGITSRTGPASINCSSLLSESECLHKIWRRMLS
jgi:hypothetical protein